MASVSVGDIYLDRVRYQEDATKWKSRPIVILSVSEDVVVAVATSFTSVGPKMPPEYYDAYKFRVAHWSHANLNKPSGLRRIPVTCSS